MFSEVKYSPDRKLLTTKEVVEAFRISPRTICNWRNRGLPFLKVSSNSFRYDYEAVLNWVLEQNGQSYKNGNSCQKVGSNSTEDF